MKHSTERQVEKSIIYKIVCTLAGGNTKLVNMDCLRILSTLLSSSPSTKIFTEGSEIS